MGNDDYLAKLLKIAKEEYMANKKIKVGLVIVGAFCFTVIKRFIKGV